MTFHTPITELNGMPIIELIEEINDAMPLIERQLQGAEFRNFIGGL